MQLVVAKVTTSERPPVLKGRLGTLGAKRKGEDYRHKVAYDVIAKSLRSLFKNQTLHSVHTWLSDPANWLDQHNVATDYKPVDPMTNQIVRNSLGVQAAADQWLKNASNYVANLWVGESEENRKKGRAIPKARAKFKAEWADKIADWNQVEHIEGVDPITNTFVKYVSGGRFLAGNLVTHSDVHVKLGLQHSVADTTGGNGLKVTTPGGLVYIKLKNDLNARRVGAVLIVNQALYRVSRDYVPHPANAPALATAKTDLLKGALDYEGYDDADVLLALARHRLKMNDMRGQQVPLINVAFGSKYL